MNEAKPLPSISSRAFFTREQLSERWSVSISTLKRREKDPNDILKPTRLGPRVLRYSWALIEEIEKSR